MVYILASVGGMAYFVYGKRQQNGAFLVAGVCLFVYPYMFKSIVALILVGLVLLAAPFLLSRQFASAASGDAILLHDGIYNLRETRLGANWVPNWAPGTSRQMCTWHRFGTD